MANFDNGILDRHIRSIRDLPEFEEFESCFEIVEKINGNC